MPGELSLAVKAELGKERCQNKKTGLCGKNSQVADPPPPQFGKPLLSKKKLGLFCILGPQGHFWSSPKNHHFG